jgi:tripartite-type tricarboxylate transporter receptor subunit TctC
MMRSRILLRAALAVVVFSPAIAQAQSPENFYKGKNVEMTIGYSVGGGYDVYARMIARFMGKHIPGNPTVVTKNMEGAGSLRLANWLYSAAPKDGSSFGTIGRGLAFDPLLGAKGAQFDATKFSWIGSANDEVSVCVAWQGTGITKFEDLVTTQMTVGGTGGGSDTDVFPRIVNGVLDTKMRLISGYPGGNDVGLAMERGEVQGRCGGLVSSINATRPDWFASRKVTVPIQVAINRNAQFPDVPAIVELAKNERTRSILRLALAAEDMDRPILAPPGVPPERLAALRAAFHAAMTDPGFVADAKRQRLEIDEVAGEKVAAIIAETFALPPDVVKAANDAMHLTGSQSD